MVMLCGSETVVFSSVESLVKSRKHFYCVFADFP